MNVAKGEQIAGAMLFLGCLFESDPERPGEGLFHKSNKSTAKINRQQRWMRAINQHLQAYREGYFLYATHSRKNSKQSGINLNERELTGRG